MIPLAPQWLIDLCDTPRERTRETIADLDQPANVARAIAYLRTAEPAVQGAAGDTHTFKTAAAIMDFGLSEAQSLDLMLGHWNERCQPPWQPDELQRKIENAATYRSKPIGSSDPVAEFSAVPLPANDDKPQAKTTRPALFYELAADVEPDLHAVSLIDEWLDQTAMSVGYGQSNVGKTFVFMDMAWSVATGQKWHTHEVSQGAVAYIAAEAGNSARKRVKALRLAKGPSDPPFALIPCPIDLLHDNGDTEALIGLLKRFEDRIGHGLKLVVLDTFSRALAGGNENDSADMGNMVKHMDRLRVATTAHLLTVHHSGKDQAKGARGHSLLRAATDTEIEVADNRIRATKQRDHEFSRDVGFALRAVPIGHDGRGRDVVSAVVDTFVPVEKVEVPMPKAGTKAALALASLEALQVARQGKRVALSAWRQDIDLTVLRSNKREDFRRVLEILDPHLEYSEDKEFVGICRLSASH